MSQERKDPIAEMTRSEDFFPTFDALSDRKIREFKNFLLKRASASVSICES